MSAQCWLFAENLLQLGFTQIDRNTHMSADNTQDHLHSKLMLVMVTFTGHKADAAILRIADFCRQHLRPACIAFERRASRRTFEIANERCTLLHIHVYWLYIALFKCSARLIYSAKVKIAQLCQSCKLWCVCSSHIQLDGETSFSGCDVTILIVWKMVKWLQLLLCNGCLLQRNAVECIAMLGESKLGQHATHPPTIHLPIWRKNYSPPHHPHSVYWLCFQYAFLAGCIDICIVRIKVTRVDDTVGGKTKKSTTLQFQQQQLLGMELEPPPVAGLRFYTPIVK